jgi:hypothetical protein
MIYLHIYLPIYLATYPPTLHIKTIYLPCQIIVPITYIILVILIYFINSSATTTLQTLCAIITSITEHLELDLQTKIAIYLGLPSVPTMLRGSENSNFVQGLAMNTENCVSSTAIKFIIFIRGHHSPCYHVRFV